MAYLIFQIYRWLALPLALAALRGLRPLLPGKLKEMLLDREGLNLQALPARPLWIHASSGEIEYAKSVIRDLKIQFPQIPILVTYFSPSAKKLIQKFPGIDLAMALPWDSRQGVKTFLDFYKPRMLLIARTDVWPEMAVETHRRKIPSLLFAATITSQSSRLGLLSGFLTKKALRSLDQIFCVSEEDLETFASIGVKNTQVAGDTRFDQVLFRLQNPNPIKHQLQPGHSSTSKIFVAGSTWPPDEEILFPAVKTWCAQGHRVILAPHEIGESHLAQIIQNLEQLGLACQRYSRVSEWTAPVLVVDQIGILQELYTWGDVAFVGGSFKDKIHSVMEPLCCGLPVLVGPLHTNNREAIQFQHVILDTGFFAVDVIQNSKEAEAALFRTLKLETPHPKILLKIRQASGATAQIISWVERHLT